MSETDRRWFKRNPDANIRFRSAGVDEAEQLLALVHSDFKTQLDQALDKSALRLSIAVLKLPHGQVVRIPVGRDPDHSLEAEEGVVNFVLMSVGRRVAME